MCLAAVIGTVGPLSVGSAAAGEREMSGYVFFDQNPNGLIDGLDAPLSGARVQVTGQPSGQVVAKTTDESGRFEFEFQSTDTAYEMRVVAGLPAGTSVQLPTTGSQVAQFTAREGNSECLNFLVGAGKRTVGSGPACVAVDPGDPADPPPSLVSLKTIPVPGPSNIDEFVCNPVAAAALGKALFWDMQAGGEGVQACASCHFHAGADVRSKNQMSPGFLGGDTHFEVHGPNGTLRKADYPFHRLADPNNRHSGVRFDSNDVTSSMGVFNTSFIDIRRGNPVDLNQLVFDPIWNVGGLNVRRVEPRNTPTSINAVFNFRNFWDGRAQNEFNGVNPFGDKDPNARVLRADDDQAPAFVRVHLEDSSAASQAVGPPLSPFEMSGDGRSFPKLGKKLLSLRPLARQVVHPADSLLGRHRASVTGLRRSYRQLIRQAFRSRWWEGEKIVTIGANGQPQLSKPPCCRTLTTNEFTQTEWNFALFWGLAIQAYEQTQVSDDSPFDQCLEGRNTLTAAQKEGFALFQGQGRCRNCHGGSEFTNASVRNVRNQKIELMLMGNDQLGVYDDGFYNIGVRRTAEDVGVGGTFPPFAGGGPLCMSRQAQQGTFDPQDPRIPNPINRVVCDGAMKAPSLRNSELTGPYFHNGGQASLRQVVEFYNRGGDFSDENIDNLDPDIQTIGFTEAQKDQLVAFLASLTDERVRRECGPFDHPQIFVPNGSPGDEVSVQNDGTGKGADSLIEIPATGVGCGPALTTFESTLAP